MEHMQVMDSKKSDSGFILKLILLGLVAVTVVVVSICIGEGGFIYAADFRKMICNTLFGSDFETTRNLESIIRAVKIPGAGFIFMTGGALAVSGLIYQEILDNRFVSPGLLGVNGAANLTGSIAALCGIQCIFTIGISFALSLTVVLIVLSASKKMSSAGNDKMKLLILGLLTDVFLQSVTGIVIAVFGKGMFDEWPRCRMFGGFVFGAQGENCIIPVILSTMLVVYMLKMFGSRLEQHEKLIRVIRLACATLLASAGISLFGNLAWIGLAVTIVSRRVFSGKRGGSVLLTFILGGTVLTFVSVLGPCFGEFDIPKSMITGVFGVIVVMVSLKKKSACNDSYVFS